MSRNRIPRQWREILDAFGYSELRQAEFWRRRSGSRLLPIPSSSCLGKSAIFGGPALGPTLCRACHARGICRRKTPALTGSPARADLQQEPSCPVSAQTRPLPPRRLQLPRQQIIDRLSLLPRYVSEIGQGNDPEQPAVPRDRVDDR